MHLKSFFFTLVLSWPLFIAADPACAKDFSPGMPVPSKGLVTLVDIGAKSCIPCKMMDPILQKMDKRYEGKADVIFIDVRYHQEEVRRFRINGIPTQIFFDKAGKEIYRHTGFMSEAAIVEQFKKMGVE
ncbi:MAG: thioredoxin family protein [Deltaproteobacteria bacterium]